jgi:hypothetical protein
VYLSDARLSFGKAYNPESMHRMIELIRQSAVPASVVRAAARGALSLPVSEKLEILVELTSDPQFSQQAALTLAAWDENSVREVLADPGSPVSVLVYFSSSEIVRTSFLFVLLENPSLSESWLEKLALSQSPEVLSIMLESPRVRQSTRLLDLLSRNPATPPDLARRGREELASLGGTVSLDNPDLLDVQHYVLEHQDEILAAENEPFHLIGGTLEETSELEAVGKGVSVRAAAAKAISVSQEEKEKLTPVQKIAAMTVGQRVMTALKGSRDERSILIRDGARVVSNAVLESPKLNEQEVEAYAGLKNVSENVLRAIAQKRKWIRYYAVARALTRNPRTPIDVSMPLIKGLLMIDLKYLAGSKEIPDTPRKFAFKLMRDRMDQRNK